MPILGAAYLRYFLYPFYHIHMPNIRRILFFMINPVFMLRRRKHEYSEDLLVYCQALWLCDLGYHDSLCGLFDAHVSSFSCRHIHFYKNQFCIVIRWFTIKPSSCVIWIMMIPCVAFSSHTFLTSVASILVFIRTSSAVIRRQCTLHSYELQLELCHCRLLKLFAATTLCLETELFPATTLLYARTVHSVSVACSLEAARFGP